MDKAKIGLLFISFALLFFAGSIFLIAKDRFRKETARIPDGSTLGPFAIANVEENQIFEQIEQIFCSPVELDYDGSHIQAVPSILGFRLNTESMREKLKQARKEQTGDFISYLFGKSVAKPIHLDLEYQLDKDLIRLYLQTEVVPRYDRSACPRQPAIDGSGFFPGHSGRQLDIEASVPLIEQALLSPNYRYVNLPVNDIAEPTSELKNLELILKNVIDTYQDEGQVTEMFFSDPSTNQNFDIARRNRVDVTPRIAFTAASTMKLPIMVSSYKAMDEEPTPFTQKQLRLMITESKNDQTDWMMENIIGGNLAPFTVTEDMKALGMEDSFLAGYFYLGAPLLDLVKTTANQRTDIDLKPDVYNQTTPADMGILMDALYRCDKDGSGLLMETFPGQITQKECGEMIELLKNNHLPYLISAGVPDSVPVAHKHGWIEENDGLLHTMSNIGAVYSPGGDYILSIYTYHPDNLIFDEGNVLFSRISSAVYEYFNPSLPPISTEQSE